MLAWLCVLLPLALYLVTFISETVVLARSTGSISLSWEATHTFLVVAVTNFIWLFADITPAVAKSIYLWLSLAGIIFILRGIVYLAIYHPKDSGLSRERWIKLLVWLNLVLILDLVFLLVAAATTLASQSYVINTQFVYWLLPGALLVGLICAKTLKSIYSFKD